MTWQFNSDTERTTKPYRKEQWRTFLPIGDSIRPYHTAYRVDWPDQSGSLENNIFERVFECRGVLPLTRLHYLIAQVEQSQPHLSLSWNTHTSQCKDDR